MARNPKFPLSLTQQRRAEFARNVLSPATEKGAGHVTVAFKKRSGEDRIIRGKAVEIAGEGSSEHVKVMTDEGIRSINLWAVKVVSF